MLVLNAVALGWVWVTHKVVHHVLMVVCLEIWGLYSCFSFVHLILMPLHLLTIRHPSHPWPTGDSLFLDKVALSLWRSYGLSFLTFRERSRIHCGVGHVPLLHPIVFILWLACKTPDVYKLFISVVCLD